MADADLVIFAEEHRSDLPPGFAALSEELTMLIDNGRPLDDLSRGGTSLNYRIRRAAVLELRGFLCTNDPRYEEVRTHGKTISRMSLTSIAGYVAGTVGISAAMATACVAFVALAILNVGVGTFCRVSETTGADAPT